MEKLKIKLLELLINNIFNNNEINQINNLLEMFHELPINEIYS